MQGKNAVSVPGSQSVQNSQKVSICAACRHTAARLYVCAAIYSMLARLATHGNTVFTTKRRESPGRGGGRRRQCSVDVTQHVLLGPHRGASAVTKTLPLHLSRRFRCENFDSANRRKTLGNIEIVISSNRGILVLDFKSSN